MVSVDCPLQDEEDLILINEDIDHEISVIDIEKQMEELALEKKNLDKFQLQLDEKEGVLSKKEIELEEKEVELEDREEEIEAREIEMYEKEEELEVKAELFNTNLNSFQEDKLQKTVKKYEDICMDKDNIITELCQKIAEIQVEKKQRLFANKSVDISDCIEGSPSLCAKAIVNVIDNRKEERFYVGATSDPNTRCTSHINNKGFKTMHLLYETSNIIDALIFETIILEKVKYKDGCVNKRKSTFGLVPNKNVYYIYFMQ